MKKVLILGGAGFIGFNLAKYLSSEKQYDLTLVDNLFRGKLDEDYENFLKTSKSKFLNLDLTKESSFEGFKEEYDYVYLLASMVGVEYVEKVPHEIIRVNTQIIMNTAEWLKKKLCKKILFTSTSECYAGAIDSFNFTVPTPETVPLVINDIGNPRFTYAVTKMLGESTFLNYSRVLGIERTIIRYHNVYGPRMGFKHVIPQMIKRFHEGENPFQVYGAHQTRSFNYIDDAVIGTVKAMESEGTNGEIYHIGDSREEITIKELASLIGEIMNFNGEYVVAGNHSGSVNRRCPDITKAKDQLGYWPKVGWVEGVKKTAEWYKNYYENNGNVYE